MASYVARSWVERRCAAGCTTCSKSLIGIQDSHVSERIGLAFGSIVFLLCLGAAFSGYVIVVGNMSF